MCIRSQRLQSLWADQSKLLFLFRSSSDLYPASVRFHDNITVVACVHSRLWKYLSVYCSTGRVLKDVSVEDTVTAKAKAKTKANQWLLVREEFRAGRVGGVVRVSVLDWALS